MDTELVRRQADLFGFKFPIAQDSSWKTINAYWLTGNKKSFTSSIFLIDKKGIIRFIHDGGEFFESDTEFKQNIAYQTIDGKIKVLLDE